MRTILAVAAILVAAQAVGLAGDVVGWRLDGTGHYPGTRPPTEWSAARNVLWATSMPDWSNASPVLAGGKLFVQSEPFNLLCVDAATGRVLWTRAHDYEQVMTDEDRRQAAADKVQADSIRQQIKPLTEQFNQIGKELRKLQAQATQPDADAEAIKSRQLELKTSAGDIDGRISALRKELAKFSKWAVPEVNVDNGYSSCTPVTDGQHVWCMFGNGVAACYDMNGQRAWIRFVAKSAIEDGLSSSPVLVTDGIAAGRDCLLVHPDELTALDARTGQTIWQAKDTPPGYGTPFVARLGGQTVAVTPQGDVVRVRDGAVLARKTGSVYYCSPIVVNSVVYFVQNISKAHGGGTVVRLLADGDGVKAEEMWKTASPRDRYYASPTFDNGLIYVLTQANVFSVLDAADGKVLKELKLDLGKGTCFPSPCLAGEFLFVSSDTGRTAVIRPGPDPQVVRINTLEKFRGTPLFDGGRIYIRGYQTLYCIADRTPRGD